MGQKVNPKGFRLGINKPWNSRWFATTKDMGKFLEQDEKMRKLIKKQLKDAGVSNIGVERTKGIITLVIKAAKPGMIIGRGGLGIEELKKKIKNDIIGRFTPTDVRITILEVERPTLDAELVMQSIATDLEKRIPFRRAIKQALSRVERAGAKGAKINVAGRLNGVDIARREHVGFGKIPLHTLRADIDYSRGVARTTYGAIGIKVWIYKGDVFKEQSQKNVDKNV